MDLNVIIIVLVALVVVNFILIVIIGKGSKKTPDLKKVEEKRQVYDEEEIKTVITSNVNSVSKGEYKEIKEGVNLESVESINTKNNEKMSTMLEIYDDNVDGYLEISTLKFGEIKFKDGDSEKIFSIEKETIYIGRDSNQCDLVIKNDNYVGRVHSRLSVENGNYYVEDLGSKNGVQVNGIKISSKTKLEDNRFKVGRTEFNIIEVQ